MEQRTPTDPRPSRGMHADHCFVDVVPSREADEELAWFFNDAASAIETPSNYAANLSGQRHHALEETEARIEALHGARTIWERLTILDGRRARVLEALYEERLWPEALEGTLGPVVGVVVTTPGVRAEHLGALLRQRTAARDVKGWLEELVAQRSPSIAAWHKEADRACAQALSAYERARGDGPSVVPSEVR